PIPLAATQVHGISDDDVKDEPSFSKLAHEIAQFIDHSDLGGYNSNKFDVPVLFDEFLRVGVNIDMKGRKLVDVQTIFHKMEQRTLTAAYKFYCQKNLENAHSSLADVKATFEVLNAQIERYPELKSDIEFLSEFSAATQNVDLAGRIVFNESKEEVFNFGKHKGKPVNQVFRDEPSYYDWMMKGDFPLQTKQVITSLRLRDFNKV
ncbi:MAG TPA: exonuclease domain-containing protein, partial [Bacteroidia bacterium]|nr:exonuclease domain-containing protein [Bacteroidia bacterium]